MKLAVAAVALIYLALLLRFQWAKPTVTWNYMAEINAQAAAVAPNDRAWPLYREALMKLEPLPEGAKREFTVSRPGDESWPDLAAYLQRNSKTLELIRQAAARPRLGFRFGDPADRPLSEFSHPEAMPSESDNPIVVNWRLPHVQQLRDVARLLSADALRASVEGDGNTATADLVAQMRVPEHCRDTAPAILTDLVSLALFNESLETLGEILADRPEAFSDSQLTDLAHCISAVAGGGRLRVRLDGVRATFKDLWQRIYSGDGHGDGHLTAEGFQTLMLLWSPPRPGRVPEPEEAHGTRWPEEIGFHLLGSAATAAIAGRREMSEFCDRLLDEAELAHSMPLWEQKESGVEAELETLRHTRARAIHYLPVVLMMPAVGHASVWVEKITQRRDAALVAIALELYRRRKGAWPDRLERLVPDLLPAVPPDRFDGRPLRYRLVDGRAVLYSIGVDRIDDGGRPCESSLGDASAWRPAKDVGQVRKDGRDVGDWILWPPVNEES